MTAFLECDAYLGILQETQPGAFQRKPEGDLIWIKDAHHLEALAVTLAKLKQAAKHDMEAIREMPAEEEPSDEEDSSARGSVLSSYGDSDV